MSSLPQPPLPCPWAPAACAGAQPRIKGCSHGVLSILDSCWPRGQPAQHSGSLRIRSRGNQEEINLFSRWQLNCEMHPCSQAERKTVRGKGEPFCGLLLCILLGALAVQAAPLGREASTALQSCLCAVATQEPVHQRAAPTVGQCSQHLPTHRTRPQRHLYRTCWTKLWGIDTMCCLSRTAVLATASPLQHISPATQAQPWGTFGWETRRENYISRVDQDVSAYLHKA